MNIFLFITLLFIFASNVEAQSKLRDTVKIRHSETEGKSYNVRATVKKIYLEEKKIMLKHAAIKGYMPAMTMTFPVRNASLLENLRVGSKGTFTIFVFKGLPTVTAVKIVKK